MDIARAFTFVFEDEEWLQKLAIGALVVFLSSFLFGLPMLVLVGYSIAITRRVMNGEKNALPAWDDIGQMFMDGLNVVIALFVYSFPALLLLCIGFAVTFLPALSGGNEDVAGALAGVTVGVWGLVLCLAFVVWLAVALVAPAIYVQYARTGELGSLFRFGEIIGIVRDNLGAIVLAAVATIVAGILVQIVTLISVITICGPIILGFFGPVWQLAVTGHLHGQIGQQVEAKSV